LIYGVVDMAELYHVNLPEYQKIAEELRKRNIA
jgi:hypothetical protein